jgi:uncharacterized coiled-coil DUF342 family protein
MENQIITEYNELLESYKTIRSQINEKEAGLRNLNEEIQSLISDLDAIRQREKVWLYESAAQLKITIPELMQKIVNNMF